MTDRESTQFQPSHRPHQSQNNDLKSRVYLSPGHTNDYRVVGHVLRSQ